MAVEQQACVLRCYHCTPTHFTKPCAHSIPEQPADAEQQPVAEVVDDDGEDFVAIDHLETLGINRGVTQEVPHIEVHCHSLPCTGDIKKAKDAGYYTCQSLLMNTKRVRSTEHQIPPITHVSTSQKLTDIKGLSEAKIDKMLEAAKKKVSTYGWKTAAEEERQVCVPCVEPQPS